MLKDCQHYETQTTCLLRLLAFAHECPANTCEHCDATIDSLDISAELRAKIIGPPQLKRKRNQRSKNDSVMPTQLD